jgi:hypothetical protein
VPPRFKVLREEVDRARRELGIRDPVVVSITRSEQFPSRYIAHRDGRHRLGVANYLGPRRASSSIWHELAHVRQAEELGGFEAFDREWGHQLEEAGISKRQIRTGRYPRRLYNRAPLEREAEELARRKKVHRLAVKRSSRVQPLSLVVEGELRSGETLLLRREEAAALAAALPDGWRDPRHVALRRGDDLDPAEAYELFDTAMRDAVDEASRLPPDETPPEHELLERALERLLEAHPGLPDELFGPPDPEAERLGRELALLGLAQLWTEGREN